jgi:hypothetical protein
VTILYRWDTNDLALLAAQARELVQLPVTACFTGGERCREGDRQHSRGHGGCRRSCGRRKSGLQPI